MKTKRELRRIASEKKFITDINLIHNNRYDYSKIEYINNKTKVCIICKEHGEFWQTPNHHLKGHGCPECNPKKKITRENLITNGNRIHNNFFDYSEVPEIIKFDIKIPIICPIHGKFWQTYNHHVNDKQGCAKCHFDKKRLTPEIFEEKANIRHKNKYIYNTKSDYVNNIIPVCIICPDHGVFYQSPTNHIDKGHGCPICSKFGYSKKEIDLIEYIKSIYSEKIIINTKKIIPPYELDIYLPNLNLAIEFNGLYWHSTNKKDDKNYHLNKTNLCKEKGIRLIHIFEDEWEHKQDIVKSRISHILNICDYKVYARECKVYEIEFKDCKQFLLENHIQGNCVSSYRLGLYLGEELVAVMTFGKPRFAKHKYEWELLRYCPLSGHNVIGGAGKLLKTFERSHNLKSLVSYCDKRWSIGNLYYKLGFNHSHDSNPTYWYFKRNGGSIRESRYKYQKHMLSKVLDKYDENLSEVENMELKENDYLKIYDCGDMTFVKEY